MYTVINNFCINHSSPQFGKIFDHHNQLNFKTHTSVDNDLWNKLILNNEDPYLNKPSSNSPLIILSKNDKPLGYLSFTRLEENRIKINTLHNLNRRYHTSLFKSIEKQTKHVGILLLNELAFNSRIPPHTKVQLVPEINSLPFWQNKLGIYNFNLSTEQLQNIVHNYLNKKNLV